MIIWKILYYIRPITILLLGITLFQAGDRQWGFLLIILGILDLILSRLSKIEKEITKLKKKEKENDKNI